MLIRSHDAASPDECRQLLSQQDFGQLIASGSHRDVPVVVPTHFVFDGDTTIHLHLARQNPIWEALSENSQALMTVIADWAYITTQWNTAPGADPRYGVPTSYYATVHARVTASPVDDESELADILDLQLGHFQPEGGHDSPTLPGTPYRKLFPAIRGLRLTVTELTGKFKFGGNKDDEHRATIARQLDDRSRPGDRAAAEHLRRRSAERPL